MTFGIEPISTGTIIAGVFLVSATGTIIYVNDVYFLLWMRSTAYISCKGSPTQYGDCRLMDGVWWDSSYSRDRLPGNPIGDVTTVHAIETNPEVGRIKVLATITDENGNHQLLEFEFINLKLKSRDDVSNMHEVALQFTLAQREGGLNNGNPIQNMMHHTATTCVHSYIKETPYSTIQEDVTASKTSRRLFMRTDECIRNTMSLSDKFYGPYILDGSFIVRAENKGRSTRRIYPV